jgi:hemoglobin/transferrin/lactoferrin receptor protein
MPWKQTKISGGTSTGFRVPNFDDMAKIFESAAGAQVVVPNPNLKPEQTLNFDLGFEQMVGAGLHIAVNGFYTLMRNAIVTAPFLFQGQDSLLYGGKMTRVVASQNRARARIMGTQVKISYQITTSTRIYTQGTYTYGRFVDAVGGEVPMDHIPPFYGKTGLRYERNRLVADVYALYNGWKHLKDYNPFGEDNLQYATVNGMPSWYVLNVNCTYQYSSALQVQVGLENILDKSYRTFASGIQAPGRNLVVKLIGNF